MKENIELKGEWLDDLIWCPSQCYYAFDYKGTEYTIYLRWRWDNPWTADLYKDFDKDLENVWELPIEFFRDDQLDEVKAHAMELTKVLLLELEAVK